MKLNVLYTSDNNYAPYLCISLSSLLEQNKEAEAITVYVVKDGWSDEYVEKLRRQVAQYGESRSLILIDGKEWGERLSAMGMLPYRGGQAPNLRLFFTEFIQPDVERLLYLDCDTIICDDLRPLFETDMGDAAMAVVLDSLTTHYRPRIGFSPEDSYFNSGVLLFDVANWNKVRAAEKLMELMRSDRPATFMNPDQDALNIALKEHVTVLSPRYNFQTTHQVYSTKAFFANYGGIRYYTAEELEEAKARPAILHAYRFLGQFPWHKNAIHPWRPLFLEIASRSQCADFTPKENKGLAFRLERILYRILPECLFLPIFKAWQIHHIKQHFKKLG